MSYTVSGTEVEADDDGYLLEPDYSDEVVNIIATTEGIELTPKHWEVVKYMRDQYREHGHTPNFRNMLKGVNEFWPEADSKAHTWTSTFAKLSINDFEKVKIAAIHPDFV